MRHGIDRWKVRAALIGGVCLFALSARESASAQGITTIGEQPTYWGSVDAGEDCGSREYRTKGWRPNSTGPHPLFLYLVGSIDPNQYATDPAADRIAQAMAWQGYAALQVQYDSTANLTQWNNQWAPLLPYQLANKASCLFDAGRPESLLQKVCAQTDKYDCSRGIAVWGHSQGAALAVMSASYDRRVSAAWVTGFTDYAHFTVLGSVTVHSDERAWLRARVLPSSRMRITNGQGDELTSGSLTALRQSMVRLIGRDCVGNVCLNGENGSGWQILQHGQINTPQYPSQNRADHCWFNLRPLGVNWKDFGNFVPDDCVSLIFEMPGAWLNGTSEFALQPSARWLAQTAALGPLPPTWLNVDFTYLPAVQAQGPYPWGILDWGAGNSNFYVKAGPAQPGSPIAPEDPKHMTIGNNATGPSTGQFEFDAQNGGALIGYWVYNSATAPATVTTRIDFADGRPPSTTSQPIAANTLGAIAPWAGGVRRVTITSSNGSALKFQSILVLGPQ